MNTDFLKKLPVLTFSIVYLAYYLCHYLQALQKHAH